MTRTLPRLNWRLLGPRRNANTASGSIASIKQMVIASSSYWRLIETPNTGTTSAVIAPLTSSISFYVVVTTGITGSSAYLTPDTNDATIRANDIQVGLYMGSGSFLGPQRDQPFSGSILNRWSKYWHGGHAASLTQSYIIEGTEALFIGIRGPTTNQYGCILGAIGESDSRSGDTTGVLSSSFGSRQYGIITTGDTAIDINFHATQNNFLSNYNVANSSHAGFFLQGGAPTDTNMANLLRTTVATITTGQSTVSGSNTLIGSPVYMMTSGSQGRFRLRDIYVTENMVNLTVISQSGAPVGVAVAADGTTATNAILFAPMSGASNLNSY